jgi:hypothetical protein
MAGLAAKRDTVRTKGSHVMSVRRKSKKKKKKGAKSEERRAKSEERRVKSEESVFNFLPWACRGMSCQNVTSPQREREKIV